jgi:hypothetical protein
VGDCRNDAAAPGRLFDDKVDGNLQLADEIAASEA